jgi:hypothetical protein
MGREVRRVPLDFEWPLNKVWEGFLNDHYVECPDCENGSTVAFKYLDHLMHLLMIVDDDARLPRRGRVPHPWVSGSCFPDKVADFHLAVADLIAMEPPFMEERQ